MATGDWSFTIDVQGLGPLAEDFKTAAKAVDNEMFLAMRDAGKQFRKEARALTKKLTKKHTGNLLRGFQNDVVRESGTWAAQVRGGVRKARHFHLLENGHQGYVPDRSGALHGIGFVKGREMMRKTRDDWSRSEKLLPYAVRVIDAAIEKGKL